MQSAPENTQKNQAFGDGAGNGIKAETVGTITQNNVAVGAKALYGALSRSDNIAIGELAFQNLNSGSKNIAVGYNAASATTIAGNNNVVIGSGTSIGNNLSYCVVIGAKATATSDNTIVLGGPDNKSLLCSGIKEQGASTSAAHKWYYVRSDENPLVGIIKTF
jgi:hypothetical protein